MSNTVQFKDEARKGLVEGINLAGNTVRPTLGAKGRNIIIETVRGGVIITNDGVTALRNLDPKDHAQGMGVHLVREGAAKSEEIAGDGTTTVSILIQEMVNEGVKYIAAGASPLDLKRGMDLAGKKLVEWINEDVITISKDDNKLKQVATISANNDPELGGLIAKLFKRVGADGVIDIQNSNDNTTKIDIVEGAEYDRGYLTPYFTTNAAADRCVFENPYVLVTDHRIDSFRDILPILDKVNKTAPVFIVSDEIDPDVMNTITLNSSQKRIKICCIKAPDLGDDRIDNLRDIAMLTGATYINSAMKMELGDEITEEMLGRCDKVDVTAHKSKIVGGYGDADEINEAIDSLKQRIENEEDDYAKSKLEKRLARLVGGVAVLYVGAPTEIELEEKKMRLDDSLKATRASLSGGILPGGGVLLAKYSDRLLKLEVEDQDEEFGVRAVAEAVKAPFFQILENAGQPGDIVLERIKSKSKNTGFDVKAGKYRDLVKGGIVDPADVTRAAIENSISIASMLLSTEALIVEDEDE